MENAVWPQNRLGMRLVNRLAKRLAYGLTGAGLGKLAHGQRPCLGCWLLLTLLARTVATAAATAAAATSAAARPNTQR